MTTSDWACDKVLDTLHAGFLYRVQCVITQSSMTTTDGSTRLAIKYWTLYTLVSARQRTNQANHEAFRRSCTWKFQG
jgi:hypothetical protein